MIAADKPACERDSTEGNKGKWKKLEFNFIYIRFFREFQEIMSLTPRCSDDEAEKRKMFRMLHIVYF